MEFKDAEAFPGISDADTPQQSKVNGTSLVDTNADSTQPVEVTEPANLFAQPPDMPRRVFEVTRLRPDTGEEYVERVEGHVAFTEHGALTIQLAVSNTLFTVRVYAAFQWKAVQAAPPTRRQLEAIARATNEFYSQQVALQNRIELANRAGAGANQTSGVASGRQLLRH